MQNCRSGHYGHSLSQCQSGDKQPRVNHSCGHRPCPQGPQHTTPQWLHKQLQKPLPGPSFLLTFTVPEPLRPCIRSPQHIAYQALVNASATARKRLAKDERFIRTEFPGFPGILHPWGRQLQYHPPIHSIVPGGGLSKDRAAWLPASAHCFGPVQALSPISRALFKQELPPAGHLKYLDPQVWAIPWNVHSQANPNGQTSCKYLAPLSSRSRPTHLDASEFLRRFLQHVLPEGFMKVRHFGFMHASCAIPTASMRLMILQRHDIAFKPPDIEAPSPVVASGPAWGTPNHLPCSNTL